MNQIVATDALKVPAPQSFATVFGTLSFIRPQVAKPAFHSAAITGGEPELLFETEPQTVPVADMRVIAESLSIDREGFELVEHPTAVEDLMTMPQSSRCTTRRSRRCCASGSTPTAS